MSEYMIIPTDSIDATADAIKAKLESQDDLVWGQDGFANAVAAISTGTQIAAGTVTGDGTTTLQISCAFKPDEIYLCVSGEDVMVSSFRGVISICILKDNVLYFTQDSSSSSVTETMPFCKHSIIGYNEANTSEIHAFYANETLTIDTVTNSSGYRFASGATYKYYLRTYSEGKSNEPEMLDVDFIDYDGTLLYSYSATDFLAMNSMPTNPTHPKLTAQGWNWTLADAKAYVQEYGKLVIGQSYKTSDDKTRVYISLNEQTHNLTREIEVRMIADVAFSGSIDWGDGNTTNISGATGNFNNKHTYSAYGDYVISITSTSDYYLGYNGSNTPFISYGLGNRDGGAGYCKKIEVSNHVIGFGRMAFQNCTALEAFSWPTSATGWKTGGSGDNLFGNCVNLKGIVVPNGVTTFPVGFGADFPSLRWLSLPKTITVFPLLGTRCINIRKITSPPVETINNVSYAYSLEYFILPGTYTTIPSDYFRDLKTLKEFTIPASVTTMSGSSAFGYPFRMKKLVCLPTTPPAITNTFVRYLPADCVIIVPYSADHSILNAYKTATNWSAGASKMTEAEP